MSKFTRLGFLFLQQLANEKKNISSFNMFNKAIKIYQ